MFQINASDENRPEMQTTDAHSRLRPRRTYQRQIHLRQDAEALPRCVRRIGRKARGQQCLSKRRFAAPQGCWWGTRPMTSGNVRRRVTSKTASGTSTAVHTGRAEYALRAWLIAAVPSLLCFLALVYIGAESWRPPARSLDIIVIGYSILAAPLLETALMLPLAFLFKLIIPRQERVRIILLAAICALAHKFGGGWPQVLASFWPFLIYSVTLTAWLERSQKDAFVLTAIVHALYNATFFGVGALGALVTAPA
jgi:hypothetical protein